MSMQLQFTWFCACKEGVSLLPYQGTWACEWGLSVGAGEGAAELGVMYASPVDFGTTGHPAGSSAANPTTRNFFRHWGTEIITDSFLTASFSWSTRDVFVPSLFSSYMLDGCCTSVAIAPLTRLLRVTQVSIKSPKPVQCCDVQRSAWSDVNFKGSFSLLTLLLVPC